MSGAVRAEARPGHGHDSTEGVESPSDDTEEFLVEISRARHRAELVTDDREALGEQLESATGGRVAALESLEAEPECARSL